MSLKALSSQKNEVNRMCMKKKKNSLEFCLCKSDDPLMIETFMICLPLYHLKLALTSYFSTHFNSSPILSYIYIYREALS